MSWIEAQKSALVTAALEQLGLPSEKQEIPDKSRLMVREALIGLLEKDGVCARDSIRIAGAWVDGRDAPANWRYA